VTVEIKCTIPLGLLSVIPGIKPSKIPLAQFYEFVSDQYATVQWDHNFEGVFSPNSIYAKTELREME
jgi:hypothetical protein